jgi:hypothetical protein
MMQSNGGATEHVPRGGEGWLNAGYGVMPRFGLSFSCALRTCNPCTAPEVCTEWLAKGPDVRFGPPYFCPNVDICGSFFAIPPSAIPRIRAIDRVWVGAQNMQTPLPITG